MFVTKLNATGSALAYSTFLGGAAVDNGERVDGRQWRQRVRRWASTSSTDFPTTAGAFDTTANGAFDGTLTKLNAAGSALVYSTYLGGNDFDGGAGLAVDGAGNAYVAGSTPSANFPTTPGAYDTTFNGGDAFVTKFNAAGSALVYSTFIGGSDFDSISAIVLDAAGNAWLTRRHQLGRLPGHRRRPRHDVQRRRRRDHRRAERGRFGAAVLDLPGRLAERGRRRHRPRSDRRHLRHRQRRSRRTSRPRSERSTGSGTATSRSSGATPSSPSSTSMPTGPRRRRRRRSRRHRRWSSPCNGSSQPQPITFDWNEAAGAVSYTIQIDDSSAFTAPLVRDQR